MKIGAVIVTYFPDKKNIKLVQQLVDEDVIEKLIIVDNTDRNQDAIEDISILSTKIQIIRNILNQGIAKALNQGLNILTSEGYHWALTMDQDSLITKKLLRKYAFFLETNLCEEVGIISTNYIDTNTKKEAFPDMDDILYVQEVISSGSLLNLSVFKLLHKFKEYYFIDQVDNEYCYRLTINNYKIVVLKGVDMYHSMGKISSKKIFNHEFYIYNQNHKRVFYRTRNKVFMIKEYNDRLLHQKIYKSLMIDFLKIFFEDNKARKIKSFIEGLVAGVKRR